MVKIGVKLLVGCCFLIGLGHVFAEESPESQTVVEVTVSKLHLRTGLGLNFPPVHILKKGTKLVVVNEKLSWLEVKLPLDTPCWIAKRLVEAKESGQGVVKGHRVNVRFRSDFKSSSIIGQARKGQELNIIGQEGLWYKVVPPEGLTGWVAKRYTRYWGGIDEYKEWKANEMAGKIGRRQLVAELKEDFKRAEEIYTDEKIKPTFRQDFSEAIAIYHRVVSQSSDEVMVTTAKERLKEIEPQQKVLEAYNKAMAKERQEHQIADNEYRDKTRIRHPKPPYDATGLIDYVGLIYRRPGTHRLVKGNKTLFFLKSDKVDLDDYYNKQVGVWGEFVKSRGWAHETIIVEDIKILGGYGFIEE